MSGSSHLGILPQRATGFTLLEVLIALVIVAIGLLGVANLQLTSKRVNYEALQRTTGTMLVQDILERMRSNAGQLAVFTNNGAGRTLTGVTMGAVNCSAAACAPATLALYDLYEWEQALIGVTEASGGVNRGGLVLPTACITIPAGAPAGSVDVAIAWRGLTDLSNPGISNCGAGSGLYDDDAGNADVYRRVLLVRTFIQ
jgi:type IV pilus assembly protein PilV